MVIVDQKFPVGSTVRNGFGEYADVVKAPRTYGNETFFNVRWHGDDFLSLEPAEDFEVVPEDDTFAETVSY